MFLIGDFSNLHISCIDFQLMSIHQKTDFKEGVNLTIVSISKGLHTDTGSN